MKKTIKIIISILIVLFTIILTTKTQANYQSIYQSSTSKYKKERANDWINKIRNMESDGEVMGLTETKQDDTLLTNGSSNNIDVHMAKNTEWGAMAILSASTEYGKQGEGTNRYVYSGSGLKTTTGNVYGIYITSNPVWTAAGGNDFINNTMDSRYIDRYDAGTKETKPGDALLEWHEKTYQTFLNSVTYGYTRGESSGIFTFYPYSYNSTLSARACMVMGQGF